MDLEKMKLFDRIEPMIGGTPLLEIQFKFKGTKRRIFAKSSKIVKGLGRN